MKNNLPKGKLGEDLACKFLQNKGYQIIFRNFRCRIGEIDIIASKNNTLIFIEVKTRWGKDYGGVEEAITPWKIKSIIKTAQYFKLINPRTPEGMRIDALEIKLNSGNELLEITQIENITS